MQNDDPIKLDHTEDEEAAAETDAGAMPIQPETVDAAVGADLADEQPGDGEPEKLGGDPEDHEDDPEEQDDDESEQDGDTPALPIASVVEAVLFAAREPLKLGQIARAVGKRTRQDAVRAAIDELNVHYLDTSRAFEIAEISGRYQLMSRPEYVGHIMRIYPKRETGEKDKGSRLTPAALDTLSIIAYKQPITRAEIERVRGVGCGPVLRALIERGTVRVAGKADVVGQPLLYGTTEAFLVEFGLGSLDELPMRNEFLGVMDEALPAMESESETDKTAAGPLADLAETSEENAP